MGLQDLIRVVHKSWILIVVCTLVGAAGVAAYSFVVTPQYVANTRLYVSVRSAAGAGTGELAQGTNFARQAVSSYVAVIDSAIVLDRVVSDLGLDITAAELAKSVEASSPAETVLIDVAVAGSDPQLAAAIANSIGRTFSNAVIDEIEKPAGVSNPVTVTTIQPALVPETPASPNVPLGIVLGFIAGLAIGILLAVVRNLLDTRIHSLRDVELVTDAPMLGAITYDPETPKRPLVVRFDPKNPRAESFRSLRTNLQFINVESGPRSFVVTSAIPGEGKSTTIANLAIAMAETGARVALVDGDLRRPRLAEYMGLEAAAGLTDVLIGRVELADMLQQWGTGGLYVLPSGRIPPNPSELLGSVAMARVLATLTAQFDIVLIDAPPLLVVTDAAVLSKLSGGALMVVASGRTNRRELAAAVSALERVGSQMVGVVMSMLPTRGPDLHEYGQYVYGATHEDESNVRATHEPLTT
ncbi:polysaccharide biosynthesis tyrosine autokinase [Glaciibacter sp. 2TAF33]|uniref:polysaccharide biosynthesis tyrosine autokinase n=1 Tax=Glaciibacter sp. 2TAF33 TaxID=3233015 RepID=UPI003F8DDE5C